MKTLLRSVLAVSAGIFACVLSPAVAQVYTIDQGGVVQTCSGTFYDSGDSTSNYQNNESYNITFSNGLYGQQVQLDFTSFQLESCCDYLAIYDGTDNSGTQLYYGNGSNSPGTVASTTGSLYVTFTSDGSVTYSGWVADISCTGSSVPNEVSTNNFSLPSCGDARTPITATFHNGGSADIIYPVVNYSINGGTAVSETIQDTILSGTDYTYTFSQLADLSASGAYIVDVYTSVTSDPDVSNDTASASVSYQSPAVNLLDTFICDSQFVMLNALGTSDYVWYGGNDLGNILDTTSMFTPMVNSDTVFYLYESDSIYSVQSLSTTGSSVDHNSLTGDDRGGIAVTDQHVFFNGDSYCARYDVNNLTNGTSLPRRDGLFSDLSTGVLYTLSNSSNGLPVGSSITSYTVDEIVVMDTNLALQNSIALSQSFNMGGAYGGTSQAGIYAGYGYVIIYTGTQGNNWYKIDLPTGNVTLLNTFSFTTKYANENWSHWGFATYENGAFYANYREASSQNISKINLTTQVSSIIQTFSNLSDMATITYSPWLDRMYYHHESSSQFGSGSEMGGYIGGTSVYGIGPAGGCPAKIYVSITDNIPYLGSDTTVCEDVAYALNPGSFDTYNWSTGSTSGQITPTTSGTYSVTTTDEYGCVNNDEVDLTVNPKPELDLGSDTTLCEGNYLELDGGSGLNSYTWSNGSVDQTLIINSQGTYAVTVEDALGCKNEDEIQVTVVSPPIIDLGNDTVIGAYSVMTYSVATGYSSYLWSTADTTPSTTFIISNNQYLSVSVTDVNGCVGYDEIFIEVLLGTENIDANAEMSVYPNPASQQVTIDLSDYSGQKVDVLLIDLTGRVVYQTNTSTVASPVRIPVETLSNGVYNVVVKSGNDVLGQQKVVKN